MIEMIKEGFGLWVSLALAKFALVAGVILVLGVVATSACVCVAISEKWQKRKARRR